MRRDLWIVPNLGFLWIFIIIYSDSVFCGMIQSWDLWLGYFYWKKWLPGDINIIGFFDYFQILNIKNNYFNIKSRLVYSYSDLDATTQNWELRLVSLIIVDVLFEIKTEKSSLIIYKCWSSMYMYDIKNDIFSYKINTDIVWQCTWWYYSNFI